MVWFLLVGGILLILIGVWGGPRRRQRPDKASRIPKEATVQEAWEILTSPVQYDEELIKIPEHKPWYIPGADRRFQRGLVIGLGFGLTLAAFLSPFMARRPAEGPQVAASGGPSAAQPAPGPTGPGEAPASEGGQQPADVVPAAPAPTSPAPASPEPAPAPPEAKPPENVTFEVAPGTPTAEIAANLKAAGLIDDEQKFIDLVTAYGAETQLKAGTFVIPAGASIDTVIARLTE